jgi:hypothetical protein
VVVDDVGRWLCGSRFLAAMLRCLRQIGCRRNSAARLDMGTAPTLYGKRASLGNDVATYCCDIWPWLKEHRKIICGMFKNKFIKLSKQAHSTI